LTNRHLSLIPALFILVTTYGWGQVQAKEGEGVSPKTPKVAVTTATPSTGEVQGQEYPLDLSPSTIRSQAVRRPHALPTDSFWDELAQCETAQDWQNGGRYAGGLGIMTASQFPKASMGTWERFGGEEFAPSPDKATRAEQIEVANRIAVKGWSTIHHRDKDWAKRKGIPVVWHYKRPAVGLTGWGCYKSKFTGKYRMAKPKLYYYIDHEKVPLFQFSWGEQSHATHDLQVLIGGVKVDSVYGEKTRQAHIAYLKKHGLSREGVPSKPKKEWRTGSVSTQSASETIKRCPQWERALKKYGLPVSRFSYIMWRESRCEPKVIGWNYKPGTGYWSCKRVPADRYKKCSAIHSYDSGLLQINSSWKTVTAQVCGSRWGDLTVLLTVECNLRVASYLYNEGGGIDNWAATSGRN